jgi:hypothetical protein
MPVVTIDVICKPRQTTLPQKPWVRKEITFPQNPQEDEIIILGERRKISFVVKKVHYPEHTKPKAYIRLYAESDVINLLITEGWECLA